jgi:aspartyl-tRNA(Asn)/glutamyl-tRNA(Gln) amidotransferase subunit A
MRIEELTLERIKEGLERKEFSATELVKDFFKKIEKEDKKIGCFLSLTKEIAFSQAKDIDKMVREKRTLPPLAGVPCSIKDNILVKGAICSAGSKILENYIAPFDAFCVEKLKEAGAIILGKTNLDEFAMGSSTEYSAFFKTKNPISLDKVPGGSSGGSAAAVSANFSIFSLGSDTGGSIRQPASFCGVVGFKPSYGRVSRFGLVAFASSLDQIGPIAKNVKDCEKVFYVISQKDKRDSTNVERKEKLKNKEKFSLGIPKEFLKEKIEDKVEKGFELAIEFFKKKGFKIKEISLPHSSFSLSAYCIIATCEASANLARYDGLRYGNGEKRDSLSSIYFETRKKFGKEVKRRIMLGTFSLSAGYFEAYYLQAAKMRTMIIKDFEKAFEKVDFIITPTSPTTPFKFGEKTKNPLMMYLSDLFTVPVNLAGLPAISLPADKKEFLDVGIQIIGKRFEDEELLKFAQIYEP